jgi:zinc/manganese transport system substrate-binding protein
MFRTLSLLLLGMASPAAAQEKLQVVTTIETFADLARRVGGDRVEVQNLSNGYQDPHFVEAKPNLMVVLNRADVLVRVGLELEIGWLPPLVVGSRNERIQRGQPGDLDLSTVIEPVDVPTTKIDRSQGDIHPMGNPHYWLPPVNAVRCAKGIRDRLEQLRPQDKAYFEAQFKQFVDELKAKATKWEAMAKPLSGLKIVTYHKSWSYVSKWLHLDEVGYIENRPGIPPSPAHRGSCLHRRMSERHRRSRPTSIWSTRSSKVWLARCLDAIYASPRQIPSSRQVRSVSPSRGTVFRRIPTPSNGTAIISGGR